MTASPLPSISNEQENPTRRITSGDEQTNERDLERFSDEPAYLPCLGFELTMPS
jgi:hypothetical protein